MITLIVLASLLINPLEVQYYLASKGVDTRVQAIQLGVRTYGQERAYFDSLRAAFLGKRKNTIVLTDPYMQGGQEWMLGFTSGDFAHCVYNLKNEKGQDRHEQSLACIAHELAHIAGLKHTKGCISLTDENVMACPNLQSLGFLPDELKRMNKCF